MKYCSEKMKQEMVRNDPLDMQPYGMILGTHRQPNKVIDKLLHTDEAKHIIIISNNYVSISISMKRYLYTHIPSILQFFKLCIVDKTGILSEDKLVAAIKDVASRSCVEGKPVGILTGNDRDTWAKDHDLLLGLFQFISYAHSLDFCIIYLLELHFP